MEHRYCTAYCFVSTLLRLRRFCGISRAYQQNTHHSETINNILFTILQTKYWSGK